MALNIGEKNAASQRTGQTSQPSLQDEAHWEVCFFQIGPTGAAQLLPRSGRNLRATKKIQLLQGRVAQDFQQICGPIGTLGVIVKAPGVIKRGRWGQKDGNLFSAPLASAFCKSDHLQLSISHFLAFQRCQMLSKKQPWQWPLTLEKKTQRLNELAKHRNQVCKTRHLSKFASLRLLQLAPRSFCHAADGIWEQWLKFNFSRGEFRKTSSRSAAPSAPLLLKHLECSKGDCEDIQPLREHGISKKARLCHLSQNPPKTSPLWG